MYIYTCSCVRLPVPIYICIYITRGIKSLAQAWLLLGGWLNRWRVLLKLHQLPRPRVVPVAMGEDSCKIHPAVAPPAFSGHANSNPTITIIWGGGLFAKCHRHNYLGEAAPPHNCDYSFLLSFYLFFRDGIYFW